MINSQVIHEAEQTSNKENVNVDIVREYLKFYKPTEKDLNYEPNELELKQLCRLVPCQVNMARWNPLNDYHEQFRREGRFKKKSLRYMLKLLLKAFNRHQSVAMYSVAEIANIRKLEWRQRKKDNLLLLSLWRYDNEFGGERCGAPNKHSLASLENTVTPTVPEHPMGMTAVSATSETRAEEESQSSSICFVEKSAANNVSAVEVSSTQDLHPPQDDDIEMVLMQAYNESQDSNTIGNSNGNGNNSLIKISSQHSNNSCDKHILNEFLNLNTESMSVGTQSMDQASIASFDSVLPLYDNFGEFACTVTSTQSQQANSQQVS